MSKLTAKQQAWVDYYKQGKTAAEAARLAGYKARDDNGFQSIGSENLRKLAVYIAERDKILETPRIADMEEINAFWTNVMRDKGEETKDRLKASELRAKAAGICAKDRALRHSRGGEPARRADHRGAAEAGGRWLTLAFAGRLALSLPGVTSGRSAS